MPRTRPQPPAPESWDNPAQPIAEPQNAGEYTPLQRELVSEIEDVQRLLKHVLNRVDVNAPIGLTLVMKLAQILFLIGKYQHSHDIKGTAKPAEKQPAKIRPSEIDQLIREREAAGNYEEITPEELAAAAEKKRATETIQIVIEPDDRGYYSSGYQSANNYAQPLPPVEYDYKRIYED